MANVSANSLTPNGPKRFRGRVAGDEPTLTGIS
jgi:hypothetical protein